VGSHGANFSCICGIPSCRGFPPPVVGGEMKKSQMENKTMGFHGAKSLLLCGIPNCSVNTSNLSRSVLLEQVRLWLWYTIFTMQTISLNLKCSAWFPDHEFALRTPCKIFVEWLVKSIKLISFATDS
jgi:hypothetical protein